MMKFIHPPDDWNMAHGNFHVAFWMISFFMHAKQRPNNFIDTHQIVCIKSQVNFDDVKRKSKSNFYVLKWKSKRFSRFPLRPFEILYGVWYRFILFLLASNNHTKLNAHTCLHSVTYVYLCTFPSGPNGKSQQFIGYVYDGVVFLVNDRDI